MINEGIEKFRKNLRPFLDWSVLTCWRPRCLVLTHPQRPWNKQWRCNAFKNFSSQLNFLCWYKYFLVDTCMSLSRSSKRFRVCRLCYAITRSLCNQGRLEEIFRRGGKFSFSTQKWPNMCEIFFLTPLPGVEGDREMGNFSHLKLKTEHLRRKF